MLSFDDDDEKARNCIFCQTTGKKKVHAWMMFGRFFAFFDITFFVHSGFLLIIKEKEGTFLYTHTHRRTSSQRASSKREREKDNGEERGTLRFVSIQQKRRRKEDFCCAR